MSSDRTIILFDGVCNLCNGVVAFIIPRDPLGRFAFAPIQSRAAEEACRRAGVQPPSAIDPDSIMVIQPPSPPASTAAGSTGAAPTARHVLERSDAALAIARGLGWPWKVAAVGVILPRSIRDALYRFVARHRYRIFGRRNTCLLPKPEWAGRFLRDPP